jgi:hypothetical protein
VLFTALLGSYNFIVCLIEAFILRCKTDAKYDCGPGIWYCILIWCITHIVMFAITFYEFVRTFHTWLYEIKTPAISNEVLNKLNSLNERVNLVCVGLGIWACICLFTTKSECVDVFSNEYSRLWNLIYLEVIVFFVVIAVLTIRFIMYHMLGCEITIKSTDETSKPTIRLTTSV